MKSLDCKAFSCWWGSIKVAPKMRSVTYWGGLLFYIEWIKKSVVDLNLLNEIDTDLRLHPLDGRNFKFS